VADFILRLGQIFTVGHAEKVIKIGQQLPKLYGKCYIGAPLLTRSFTCTMHLVHYKVVQQHNLGDVANSIPRLCTETSSSQQ